MIFEAEPQWHIPLIVCELWPFPMDHNFPLIIYSIWESYKQLWSDLGYQQLPHNVTCESTPTVLTNEWSVSTPAEISLSYPPPSSPLQRGPKSHMIPGAQVTAHLLARVSRPLSSPPTTVLHRRQSRLLLVDYPPTTTAHMGCQPSAATCPPPG